MDGFSSIGAMHRDRARHGRSHLRRCGFNLAGVGLADRAVSSLLFHVHMLQHALLMMIGPPLIWLGWPLLPLLLGLPKPVRAWFLPLAHDRGLRRVFRFLSHPIAAVGCLVGSTLFWHAPAVYDMAQRSAAWHYLEHACFFGAALVFWHSVVRPFPSRPAWSEWLLIPCLLMADIQNTILSAVFVFSDRVLYPYYLEVPRLAGWSAIDDQAAAGVIMWVPGSIAFLVPLFWIGIELLHR